MHAPLCRLLLATLLLALLLPLPCHARRKAQAREIEVEADGSTYSSSRAKKAAKESRNGDSNAHESEDYAYSQGEEYQDARSADASPFPHNDDSRLVHPHRHPPPLRPLIGPPLRFSRNYIRC